MGPLHCFVFSSLAIVAKLSFSPYLPNSPLSPTFMGPLHCFVFFLVGNCGKNNCHFRHICQIRRFRQLLWAPFTALCFSSLAIVAKIIVIFAIFAKFAAFANFYGPPSPLCVFPRWRSWQNCHFRHICQIRRFRQLLWVPFTALCFSSLAIVAKLSFSPYLPNSPLSSTFMGPLNCFVFLLVGDCGKIVIFAIFAKFANIFSFLPFLLLCAFLDISRLIRPNVSICKQLGLSLYC